METRRKGQLRWWILGACALVVVAASQLPLAGQDAQRLDATRVQLERQVNGFFDSLLAGESDEAFDSLLQGSPIAERIELVRDLKAKTNELETRYGRHRGYERLDARSVGQDVMLFRYLFKCENYPVVWHFTYYRVAPAADATSSRESWKLISLKFDTQLEAAAR